MCRHGVLKAQLLNVERLCQAYRTCLEGAWGLTSTAWRKEVTSQKEKRKRKTPREFENDNFDTMPAGFHRWTRPFLSSPIAGKIYAKGQMCTNQANENKHRKMKYSAGKPGKGGYNEIIGAKYLATRETTVLETERLCVKSVCVDLWGSVWDGGWKKPIVWQCNSSSQLQICFMSCEAVASFLPSSPLSCF